MRRGRTCVSVLAPGGRAATVWAGKSPLCKENSEISEIAEKPLWGDKTALLPCRADAGRTHKRDLGRRGQSYFSAISDVSESSVHNTVPAANDDLASPGTAIRSYGQPERALVRATIEGGCTAPAGSVTQKPILLAGA